jgi:hypothetical protein
MQVIQGQQDKGKGAAKQSVGEIGLNLFFLNRVFQSYLYVY